MYLFFDTETTGLPLSRNEPASALENWPRIVQIAWITFSSDGRETGAWEYIIKPDGFSIPDRAAEIHGITTEVALKNGIAIQEALTEFVKSLRVSDMLIAHNIRFDLPIVEAELIRGKWPATLKTKKRFCTMQTGTGLCRIPAKRGGYKWPTLPELHQKLFKKNFEGAHRALTDTRACAKCFFEMQRLGLFGG